jgi:hypothetical protein
MEPSLWQHQTVEPISGPVARDMTVQAFASGVLVGVVVVAAVLLWRQSRSRLGAGRRRTAVVGELGARSRRDRQSEGLADHLASSRSGDLSQWRVWFPQQRCPWNDDLHRSCVRRGRGAGGFAGPLPGQRTRREGVGRGWAANHPFTVDPRSRQRARLRRGRRGDGTGHEQPPPGITFANFYRPHPSLSIDADLSLARARLGGSTEEGDRVPGAMERVFAGGIAWAPERGLYGAMRLRHFGAYPLIEDNSVRAEPATLVNAEAGFTFARGVRLEASLLNLLDSRASDIQPKSCRHAVERG